jgi:hypothetical protein
VSPRDEVPQRDDGGDQRQGLISGAFWGSPRGAPVALRRAVRNDSNRDGPRPRRYGRSQRRPPGCRHSSIRGFEHHPKVAIRWSHTSEVQALFLVHALFRIEPPGSI